MQIALWSSVAPTISRFGLGLGCVCAVDHALRCAADTGDVFFTPRTHAVAARLWSELNDKDKAAHYTQIATDLAAEFGMAKDMTTLLI